MHSISHSLAQRGALRTGARWHPYVSPRSSGGGSSQTLIHADFPDVSSASLSSIHTPATVPSITPPHSLSGEDRTGNGNPQRAKYLVSLLDQAVRSLGEIWQPRLIPAVFTIPAATPGGTAAHSNDLPIPPRPNLPMRHQSQLPSPISPMTQPSPPQPRNIAGLDNNTTPTGLVPLKGFVHEVLRRSRTSASALQTALCYIEAVRAKIPELYEQEMRGEGAHGEPDLTDRIVLGEEDENFHSTQESGLQPVERLDQDNSAQVQDFGVVSESVCLSKKRKMPSAPLPPLPPLPTPLLCPRRTFLAALILASKFTQDKCYSNRAWAKLSGLPAREIGRCERALGDALEWRLWVGKTSPAANAGGPADLVSTHSLSRCRSESDLKFSARPQGAVSSYMPSPPSSDAGSPELNRASGTRALGRFATVPAISSSDFQTRQPRESSNKFVAPVPVDFSVNYHQISLSTIHEHRPFGSETFADSRTPPDATPTLICSPSSIGERTIQVNQTMGTFTDDIATPISSFPAMASDGCTFKAESAMWHPHLNVANGPCEMGTIYIRNEHWAHVQ